MPMCRRQVGFVVMVLLLAGCAHRVAIRSEPSGAQVQVGRRDVGVTPVEVTVWGIAFRHPMAHVTRPGFRQADIDLGADIRPFRRVRDLLSLHWRRAIAMVPGSEHDVIMIRKHGQVGTWDSEEVE